MPKKLYETYDIIVESEETISSIYGALSPMFINDKLIYYLYQQDTRKFIRIEENLSNIVGITIKKIK